MNEQIKNIYMLTLISFPVFVFGINYLKPNWIYIVDNKGNIVICEKLLYSYSLLFSLILLFILLLLRNLKENGTTENGTTENGTTENGTTESFENINKNLTNNSSGSDNKFGKKILDKNSKLNFDKDNMSFFPTFYYE